MLVAEKAPDLGVLHERDMPKLIILDSELNVTGSEPGALELVYRLCGDRSEVAQLPAIVKQAIRRALDTCTSDTETAAIALPVPKLVVRATLLSGPVSQCIAVTVEQMATREHLRSAHARFRLSTREVDVLTMLVRGNTARDIANELCISQNTVKEHVKRVYGKLSVSTRAEAVARLVDWRY